MFTKVLARYSKKFLKKKSDSYEDQAEFDAEKSMLPPPVVDYSDRIDRILEFYTDITQKLLQKLEGLDFDPVLPESSQKVIKSDQTVEGLKESDLSQFPNQFYGIVLFKKTLEQLEHRITHQSKGKAGNVKELVEAHEEAFAALNVPDLLVHYKLPSQVVNGYWFYDDLPQYSKNNLEESRTIMYIPPNAVDNLKKLPRKGTFKCEADFKIDPDVSFAIRAVKDIVTKIDGFVCLDEIVSTDATGFTKRPSIVLTCDHGFSTPESWRCSACLGRVTGYKHDASSNNHVYCHNCGYGRCTVRCSACFCRRELSEPAEWKEKVERLEDLVEKLESQIASMQMVNDVNSGSLQDIA